MIFAVIGGPVSLVWTILVALKILTRSRQPMMGQE